MNNEKLNNLFRQAGGGEPAPSDEAFVQGVMRRLSREPVFRPYSFSDQVNAMFPRLAGAAIALIVLCAAGDFALTAMGLPELTEGAAQASGQGLFPLDGI